VAPTESVAVTWKLKPLALVGVPESKPAVLSSGRWEASRWSTAKVMSPVPPVAVIGLAYSPRSSPSQLGKVVVVIVTARLMVIV